MPCSSAAVYSTFLIDLLRYTKRSNSSGLPGSLTGRTRAGRLVPLLATLALLSAASAAALAAWEPSAGARFEDATVAAGASGSLDFQPILGLPATDVEVIGASPGQAPGEVWAQGRIGDIPAILGAQQVLEAQTLLRYTSAGGAWQVVPVQNSQGQALSFEWWGSEVTPDGGVLLAGEGQESSGKVQSIVTRDPGGAFQQAPAPSASGPEAAIGAGEQLFPSSSSAGRASADPLIAALDGAEGHTGALVVPVWASPKGSEKALAPGVLHYDGSAWTREPLCSEYESETCTPVSAGLEPLALSAGSPQSAWLLARAAKGQIELFARQSHTGSGTPVWVQVQFSSGLLSAAGTVPGVSISAPGGGAMLTATSQGAWVDLEPERRRRAERQRDAAGLGRDP